MNPFLSFTSRRGASATRARPHCPRSLRPAIEGLEPRVALSQSPALPMPQLSTITPASISTVQEPRPEMAGLRVQAPGIAAIYLIDDSGYRRWIPDPATYNNLFRDWNGILHPSDINQIPGFFAFSPEKVSPEFASPK